MMIRTTRPVSRRVGLETAISAVASGGSVRFNDGMNDVASRAE